MILKLWCKGTNKRECYNGINAEPLTSIFGCLERIEEKLDKQPVQTEQGESENNRNLAEALSPLVDSMNRTNRNLCVLRDGLKIISDRQKKDKEDLMVTVKFVLNYEDSIRRRYKMMQDAAMRDSIGRLMIRQ